MLEKGMAAHSSILTWRLPWAEEPGGLQSMGVLKNQTLLSDSHTHTHTHTHTDNHNPHRDGAQTLSTSFHLPTFTVKPARHRQGRHRN